MKYEQASQTVAVTSIDYVPIWKQREVTQDPEIQRIRKILLIILGVLFVSVDRDKIFELNIALTKLIYLGPFNSVLDLC